MAKLPARFMRALPGKTYPRPEQRQRSRGEEARCVRQPGVLPALETPGGGLQFRQSALSRDPRANQQRNEFPKLGVERRFGDEEQRHGQEQPRMNRDHRQREDFCRAALRKSEKDEDEPGNPAQRQPQCDRIPVAAHEAEPRAQPVQRAAEE